MSQDLAIQPAPVTALMTPEPPHFRRMDLKEIQVYAMELCKSGFFKDATQASQAFAKIVAGQELGIPPFQAMNQIHSINGKLELSATLMASLVQRSGWASYRIIEHSNTVCKIQFNVNGTIYDSQFTMQDAIDAGLTNNPTYKKYPRNMLYSRAMSNGVRWFCPGVLGGIAYIEGELMEPSGAQATDETSQAKPAGKPTRGQLKAAADAGDAKALRDYGAWPGWNDDARAKIFAQAEALEFPVGASDTAGAAMPRAEVPPDLQMADEYDMDRGA